MCELSGFNFQDVAQALGLEKERASFSGFARHSVA